MTGTIVSPERRLVMVALAGGIAAGAANAATGQGTSARAPTRPRQGWAHKDGRFHLLANGKPQVLDDPMAYLRIQEAFGRYGIAYDEGRGEVLASLFTDDAVIETAQGSGTPFQTVRGHPAVIANFASVWAQQQDQRRHCFTNVVIERLTQAEATALAYAIVTVAADGLILGATVIYTAELRRGADGLWRFARMFIGMDDYAGRAPDVKRD